jgi:WD40 repeat protein
VVDWTDAADRRRAITRGAISIWDASRGQRIATLEGHTAEVTALTFTADSRTLVSAGGDGQVRLWEAREPPAHREALAAPFRIHRVLASTDGQRLMVRGTDRTEFRELATLNLIASREGPRGTLFDVRPDLREGAFGESDLVNLYDFMNMEQILQFRQLRARSLIYSPDSRWIVLGGDDGTVSVWETEKRVRKLEFHPVHDPVRVLAVSPRREHLAVLENDGRIRFYNPETGRESRAPLEKPGRAGRATFSPDGRWLAVDDVAGVRLHDLRKGEMRVLNASGLRLGRFAFAPDSRTLVATYGEPTIWLWNVATGQEMGAIRGCHSGYDSACFSADGTQLIAGGRDGCVTSWRALPPEGLSQQQPP